MEELRIRVIHETAKNKANPIIGIVIGILGYSVYVQATKIDKLSKEIKELKKGK